MRIKISKHGDLYTADITDFPGSPSVGRGSTEVDAVLDLLFVSLFDVQRKPLLLRCIDFTKPLEIERIGYEKS